MRHKLTDQLMQFGLNQLEAEVYLDLLTNSASTGYAIGKRIGKATANVYKALDSLAQLGAIQTSEEGKSKLCQAIPPDEFVAQLENAFEQRKETLLSSLKEVAVEEASDERIYRLDSVDLILQKAKQMLADSQAIAVMDVFPQLLELLRTDIEQAIQRNVQIILQVYAPVEIDGATITLIPSHADNLATWRSEQLNLIVDAKESLLALMSPDLTEVYQSIWSQSVYLAFILHVGLIRENDAHQILKLQNGPTFFEEAQSIVALDGRFSPENVLGLKEMLDRFGPQ